MHPKAIQVMAEKGIDISGHTSKVMTQFYDMPIDVVITVCGNAAGVRSYYIVGTTIATAYLYLRLFSSLGRLYAVPFPFQALSLAVR